LPATCVADAVVGAGAAGATVVDVVAVVVVVVVVVDTLVVVAADVSPGFSARGRFLAGSCAGGGTVVSATAMGVTALARMRARSLAESVAASVEYRNHDLQWGA
jgi:hypothetical protein